MVRTNGYGIDFILAGPQNQTTALPDLEISDFSLEEIGTRFHLWDVDSGQKNIFTASDGHGEEAHQLRKYSAAEYYTCAGLKPFEQDDRIPLVALGGAVFPTSMKGTLPGLTRCLVKLLKQAEYEGLLVTVPVTEYMTSSVSYLKYCDVLL
ncbi:hypothetical protein MFLAVUS_001091 [Mucor flavus]|uniref:Uncharacterized protein n=1 Tax=Mucor flavus TaxID=439312 RepID=A0ABP9YLK3_9FUNG